MTAPWTIEYIESQPYLMTEKFKLPLGRDVYLNFLIRATFDREVYDAISDILCYWVPPGRVADQLRRCHWTERLQETFGDERAEALNDQLDKLQHVVDQALVKVSE